MTPSTHWRRVNRERPCPICGRPDWCAISEDGSAVICPRVESSRRVGDAGYLHRLTDAPVVHHHIYRPAPATEESADFGPQVLDAIADLDPGRLFQLAVTLGVSQDALIALGVGWHQQFRAYSFPMTDANGRAVGIRLRGQDGRKFSVKGGKEGLFLPNIEAPAGEPLLIVEGATDVCAVLDMGFSNAIGRPSCSGAVRLTCELCQRRKVTEVVVIADNDCPGRRGADNLASTLRAFVTTVRVIEPPAGIKDARAWLKAGGIRADVEQAIASAPIQRGVIRAGVTR